MFRAARTVNNTNSNNRSPMNLSYLKKVFYSKKNLILKSQLSSPQLGFSGRFLIRPVGLFFGSRGGGIYFLELYFAILFIGSTF